MIKKNGAIVLTASQPFTSALVMSNLKMFKYEWIWKKTKFANFALIKKQPRKLHENVLVFYMEQPVYNPHMEQGKPYTDNRKIKQDARIMSDGQTLHFARRKPIDNKGFRYPASVIAVQNPSGSGHHHPTQKPVALFEYLIRTYTNEGDTVLDNCAGSGTTGVACLNTNRRYILIEKEQKYYDICVRRCAEASLNLLSTNDMAV